MSRFDKIAVIRGILGPDDYTTDVVLDLAVDLLLREVEASRIGGGW